MLIFFSREYWTIKLEEIHDEINIPILIVIRCKQPNKPLPAFSNSRILQEIQSKKFKPEEDGTYRKQPDIKRNAIKIVDPVK